MISRRRKPTVEPDHPQSVSVTDAYLHDLSGDTAAIRRNQTHLVRAVQGLALAVLALAAVQASKGGRS